MRRVLHGFLVTFLSTLSAACAPIDQGPAEGGANANDRSNGNAEGDVLETGAMAVSPTGKHVVARRNTSTLVVDVAGNRLTELNLLGERFVFSKTREIVYVVLGNREGVVAIDLATTKELWRTVPAFTSGSGAHLAKVTDDDGTLLLGDEDRLFFLDPKTGDVRDAVKVGGSRPVDLELFEPNGGDAMALVVASTRWENGGPHTPVSLVDLESRAVRSTIDVPNCAAPIEITGNGKRALLSPTFCTPGEELVRQGWKNPDPVSVIDIEGSGSTAKLGFVKNLPGFGPVAKLADGRAVAYLDMKRIDRAMFDDPSQIPAASGPQYHLMTITPETMRFTLDPIGASLPRFAPSKDGKSLLVDASVMVVRNEAKASITLDASGIRAEVSGAFGDTSGSLFGIFDLQSRTYVPFAGPSAALDRFVQLGDGSRVFTLKENGRSGDLFAIDVAGRASFDLGRSLRDIGILPDGRTLVLRIRLESTADGRLREEFCFSTDARTCASSVVYTSAVPMHDP